MRVVSAQNPPVFQNKQTANGLPLRSTEYRETEFGENPPAGVWYLLIYVGWKMHIALCSWKYDGMIDESLSGSSNFLVGLYAHTLSWLCRQLSWYSSSFKNICTDPAFVPL